MNVLDMLLEALSPQIILLLTAGVVVGIIGGALPGISSTTTAALMATFAFTMDTTSAVMFMAATQVGSTYGGSISASILNIPGTPASAATALEAYPLAQKGEGQKALAINVAASFWGNTIGALLLLVVFPVTLSVVLYFGSWEMFWFSIFGLVICAQLCEGVVFRLPGIDLLVCGVRPYLWRGWAALYLFHPIPQGRHRVDSRDGRPVRHVGGFCFAG